MASLAAQPVLARSEAAPRAVTPRAALGADELNNIAVFKAVSPSVVNITALSVERELFSANALQVPRGTGTGIVWDERGHIVTHFHVIQEAYAARVTLADQSSHRAQLVGVFSDRDIAVLKIPRRHADRAGALPAGRPRHADAVARRQAAPTVGVLAAADE